MPREEKLRRLREMKQSGFIAKLMGNNSEIDELKALYHSIDRYVT